MKNIDFKKIENDIMEQFKANAEKTKDPFSPLALTIYQSALTACRLMLEKYHEETLKD